MPPALRSDSSGAPRALRPRSGALVLLAALVLAGCAIAPKPATDAEVAKRVTEDRSKMFVNQEPVGGPLTYSDVAARALKYNLDFRLKAMEGALSQGLLDVARWDMFPRVLLNAGYVTRSPADGSRTRTIETGFESLFHQTSTERNRSIASAEFSWNILDFGVSYYRARQQADQVLIAEERKRKVVQNILVDTRNAYWRALGAQRLSGRIDGLLERSQKALERARQIEQQGLMPQPQVLAYQRALLDSIVLLQYRRQELELSKQELTALMNLPTGTAFTLVDMSMVPLPAAPGNVAQLEEIALNRRPELREEDYRSRITANDVRRAIVSALPGLGVDLSGRYDSNRYLLDNTWVDGGLRLSMNLFKLASIPTLMQANEAQKQVDDARRMAQAMAIMTQVRVASLRFGLSVAEYQQVAQSASVDERILGYARSAASVRIEGELEVIRNEARALLSEYQRHIAYANAQAAWGRIYNSLGYDVEPPPLQASVAEVAAAIDRSLAQWQQATFVPAAPRSEAVSPIAVMVDHPKADERAAIGEALRAALVRNGLRTVETPAGMPPAPGAMVLQVQASVAAPQDGTRHGTIEFRVLRPDGRSGGASRYGATLPASTDARAFGVLAGSAVDASAAMLREWAEAHAAPLPQLVSVARD
jgi:outer membrane protein TolC